LSTIEDIPGLGLYEGIQLKDVEEITVYEYYSCGTCLEVEEVRELFVGKDN
jgi:hypothetical protein